MTLTTWIAYGLSLGIGLAMLVAIDAVYWAICTGSSRDAGVDR